MQKNWFENLSLFGVLLLPLFGYLVYSPGLTSGFFFDDFPNLVGLEEVSDLNSAFAFVLQPKGGPLGRPVAMFSFLLNSASWDSAAQDFIFTNICIHLLNGLLLLWCALRAVRLLGWDEGRAAWFAFALAGLWMMQPLLVSASLMVVQRMTTLAATFALLGILLFLHGLARVRSRPLVGYIWMSSAVIFGTLIGALTKENGALLPLMLLVLQGTVLSSCVQTLDAQYLRWRRIFLVLPSLAIIGYMLYLLPSMPGAYGHREFTFEQRVMTEARILMQYLGLILFPRRNQIGPFQDDFPLSNGLLDPAETLASCLAIGALLTASVLFRKRIPVFSFAVLWFFAGHLIESTIIPLELYFEHRNYLPAIGPLAAIVVLALHGWPGPRIGPTVLLIYGALVVWVCFTVTSVFGDKNQAAILWQYEHPDSIRSTQNYSLAYSLRGDYGAAARVITAYSDRHPEDIGVAMQSLQLSCLTGNAAQRLAQLRERDALFESGRLNSVVCGAAEKIAQLIVEGACTGVAVDEFTDVSREILSNRKISAAREVSYCLNDAQAMLYFNERDFQGTMEHLNAAFSYRSYWTVAERLIEVPVMAGRLDLARESITTVRARMPKNVFQAKTWESRLRAYEAWIERIESEPRTDAKQ